VCGQVHTQTENEKSVELGFLCLQFAHRTELQEQYPDPDVAVPVQLMVRWQTCASAAALINQPFDSRIPRIFRSGELESSVSLEAVLVRSVTRHYCDAERSDGRR
jgi:hypothetical protein